MTGSPDRKRKISISEVTTIGCTFEEDVRLYADAGCDGIGVWGFKMEPIGWQRARELMREHGLAAANCIPETNSILPYVLSPVPADPRARVEAFLPNMERMAKLDPETIVVITGPRGDRSYEEARDLCLEGFERIGKVAGDLGVTVALEPIHRSAQDALSTIWDVPGTLDLLEQIDQPSFKMLFDTWHLWDTPDILGQINRHIDRIAGVHIGDWREPTRHWLDRAFPGEGVILLADLIDRLDAAGFRGFYDVEIFSDDGRFGMALVDAHWRLDPTEIVRRSVRMLRS